MNSSTSLSLFIFWLTAIGCSSSPGDTVNAPEYKLFTYEHNVYSFTKNQQELSVHMESDSLIASKKFVVGNKPYFIGKFYHFEPGCDDADYVAYEIELMGIIYRSFPVWGSYQVIHCSDDSIDHIIRTGLEVMLTAQ